ncbi:MAG: prephenate dehydrogenase [Gammaproteobacteria bacterium]|nr:prephenate dehydrogenase [Gammaproteobacteria bacterium]
MENLINNLEINLKELYRKAIDADNQLNELKKQGHGKFSAVFADSGLFSVQADKFMPYLEETAEDILNLKNSKEDVVKNKEKIEKIVKKLHLLHTNIAQLSQAVRD